MNFVLDKILAIDFTEAHYHATKSQDCRIYTPENLVSNFANVWKVFNVFNVYALYMWVVKMLMFRNLPACWILSFSTELIQLTIGTNYPGYQECWWEMVFIDFLGTNALVIFLGDAILNVFKIQKYHWFIEPTEEFDALSNWESFKYFLTMRKEYINQDRWHIFSSCKNFILVLWVSGLTLLFDLTNWVFKYVLRLPMLHWIRIIRSVILGMNGFLMAADYYGFITKRQGASMGINIFFAHLVVFAEISLLGRYVEFDLSWNLFPMWLKALWLTLGVSAALVMLFLIIEQIIWRKVYNYGKIPDNDSRDVHSVFSYSVMSRPDQKSKKNKDSKQVITPLSLEKKYK